MKIQCSEPTHDLLTKLGGFKLECRGNIDVKASNDLQELWLAILYCNNIGKGINDDLVDH